MTLRNLVGLTGNNVRVGGERRGAESEVREGHQQDPTMYGLSRSPRLTSLPPLGNTAMCLSSTSFYTETAPDSEAVDTGLRCREAGLEYTYILLQAKLSYSLLGLSPDPQTGRRGGG